jgi:glutamyl-tRNA reductase
VSKQSASISVFGLNHKTAPVGLREKVAFGPSDVAAVAESLQSSMDVGEFLILSTCNRTEIYLYAGVSEVFNAWFANHFGVSLTDIEPHLYHFENLGALQHAARVASGLDSMVVGETQILGQFKDAYRRARDSSVLGSSLEKFFQCVFAIAKDVRTKTDIGAHSVSLASVSLKACARIFHDFSERHVLFIGAGEMVQLCAQHFSAAQFETLTFSNRTRATAEVLASRFGGKSLAFECLPQSLQDFDIVVSCTASPIPIIGKGSIENAVRQRKREPMALFDLAVPRDIEESVSKIEDVFLFSIDDLGELVKLGLSVRKNAVDDALSIIEMGIEEYKNWSSTRAMVPVVKAFRNHGEDIMNNELQQALSSLRNGVDAETVLSKFAHSLNNRFLDRPCRALNKAASSDKEQLANALLRLFYLDTTK